MTARRRSVCALCQLAMLARVFALIALDAPELGSAAWLAVLGGGVLGLGALVPAWLEGKSGRGGFETLRASRWGRTAALLLGVVLAYDASAVVRLLSGLSAYAAMTDFPHAALYLPVLLVSGFFVWMGADSLSGTALIWRKAGALLGGLLFLAQAGGMKPGWLTPVLGPGGGLLAQGVLRAGGLFAALTLSAYVLCGAREQGKCRLGVMLLGSVALTASAAAAFAMLVPSMPGGPATRLFRMEALMDNGLTGLSMELFYVLLLEGGLLLTAACETLGAAVCLTAFVSPRAGTDALKRRRRVVAGLVVLAEYALIAAELSGRATMLALSLAYAPLTLLSSLLACVAVARGKRTGDTSPG